MIRPAMNRGTFPRRGDSPQDPAIIIFFTVFSKYLIVGLLRSQSLESESGQDHDDPAPIRYLLTGIRPRLAKMFYICNE